MNKSFFSFFALVLLALAAPVAWGEKADKDKPIYFTADASSIDDAKESGVLTGNVVLTKGSMLIRGGKAVVHKDVDGYQYGVVTAAPGKLAFFRQKREGVDEFIEGEGETIDYDGRADVVKFISKAQLRRYRGATLSDEFSGWQIVYNNVTDVFTQDGAPVVGPSSSTSQPGAPAGRVKGMLTPKPSSAVAVPPASAASGALRETTTLDGKKP